MDSGIFRVSTPVGNTTVVSSGFQQLDRQSTTYVVKVDCVDVLVHVSLLHGRRASVPTPDHVCRLSDFVRRGQARRGEYCSPQAQHAPTQVVRKTPSGFKRKKPFTSVADAPPTIILSFRY